jgi:hypothetical protein
MARVSTPSLSARPFAMFDADDTFLCLEPICPFFIERKEYRHTTHHARKHGSGISYRFEAG